MKKIVMIMAIAALALSAFPALAGNPKAGEVYAFDEWGLPIMVEGAKGVSVQATQEADFLGDKDAVTRGSSVKQFANDGNWLPVGESYEPGPMNNSDELNR